jgi:hypothetical protein
MWHASKLWDQLEQPGRYVRTVALRRANKKTYRYRAEIMRAVHGMLSHPTSEDWSRVAAVDERAQLLTVMNTLPRSSGW